MTPLQTSELAAATAAAGDYAAKAGYGAIIEAEASLVEGLCIAIVNAVDAVRAKQMPTT